MTSNRPLFDDEDLPDWLKDAGISYAGGTEPQKSTNTTKPVITEPSSDFAMDWDIPTALQGPIQPLSNQERKRVTDSLPRMPAITDDALIEPETTSEQLPWEESGAPIEPAAVPQPSLLDDYPTPIGLPPESPTEAPKIKRLRESQQLQAKPVEPEPVASADDLSWLDQPLPDVSGEQAAPPAGEIRRIKKLPSADEAAQPPADAPKPAIKRLPSQPMQAKPAEPEPAPSADDLSWLDQSFAELTGEQPEPPKPGIKRLPSQPMQAKPPEPEPAPAEFTFEDWERQQFQPEPEAQSDPSDKLLDEVPEWFSTAGEPAQPEAVPAADKLTADAPDWFKHMDDLSGTPLVGPETIQPSAPEPTAVADSDVPDWFKGTGVDNLDFDAMFTSEAPEEPAKRPSSKLAAYMPETPKPAETPTPPFQAAPVEEPLDWMAELPALDDLVDTLEPAASAQPIPADGGNWTDSLDWMVDATPVPDQPAEKAELPAWMQQAAPPAPSQPAEPEVERGDFNWSAFEDKPAAPEAPKAKSDEVDWSFADEPTEAQPPQEETLVPAADLPDWMQQAAPPQEAAPAASDASLDEFDWSAFGVPSDSTDSPTAQPVSDVPDWLQQSAPAAPASEASDEPGNFDWLLDQNAPEPALSTESASDADMPEWMRDMSPVGTEPAPEPAASDMDWLSGVDFLAEPAPEQAAPKSQPIASPAGAPAASSTPSAKQDSGSFNVDALLSLSEDALAAQEAPSIPVEPEAVPADFLEESIELPPYEPTTQEQALTPVSPSFDLEAMFTDTADNKPVPAPADLLDSLLPPSAPAEPASPPRAGRLVSPEAPGPALQDSPKPREELPEWIAEMQPERAPTVLRIGDQEIRVQEKPLTQLSEQLRDLRERAKTVQSQKTEASPATAGPLSGISGAIPTIPDVLKPGTAMTAVTPVISDAQARRVKLIQNMLERDEETFKQRELAEDEREAQQAAETVQPAPRTRARPKIDRILLSLLLAVIIVVPFFTDAANLTQAPGKQLSAAQNAVAQTIDAIQPNQPVLMAFEYGPTGAGELDDLARTVLRDLVKRGARPVIVSTNAAGAMHAQSLMALFGANANELKLMNRAADKPLLTRKDYVVLRYLPGGAAGVRAFTGALLSGGFQQNVIFTSDIEGKPSGLTDADIAALKANPAFILTESQDDVRNWVEQYQAGPNDKPLPIVLLSSASASAAAESYASSATDKRIVGPLVGLRDSMVYQAARQSPDANAAKRADQRWQSVGLGALLASVLILVGVAVNLLRSLRRRKPVDTRTS